MNRFFFLVCIGLQMKLWVNTCPKKPEKEEQDSFEFLEYSIVISLGHLLWRDLMRPKPWIITVIMVWLATFLIPSNYPKRKPFSEIVLICNRKKKNLGHIHFSFRRAIKSLRQMKVRAHFSSRSSSIKKDIKSTNIYFSYFSCRFLESQ